MAFLPGVEPQERPEVAVGQGLWPLIKSLIGQIPNTMMDPTPIALSKGETLGSLIKFLKDPTFSDAQKEGIDLTRRAVEKDLFGPRTYGPLQGIFKVDPSQEFAGAVGPIERVIASNRLAKDEEIGILLKYLNENKFSSLQDAIDVLMKQSPWDAATDLYQSKKLVPWGFMGNHPTVLMLSPPRSSVVPLLKPFNTIIERKAMPHEFSHLAHFGGDDTSVVSGLYDTIKSRKSPLWQVRQKISESEWPGSTGNAFVNRIINEDRMNPNELLADFGAMNLRDVLKGGK